MMNKLHKRILLLIFIFAMIITIGVTYAYFEAQSSESQIREVVVDTGTVDTLTFSINKDISLGINQENFGRTDSDISDSSTLTARLTPNNTSGNASDNYNLFFIMDYNDLIYTSEEELPELVIEVTDPNGNTVEQIANLEGDDGVFDITGKRKAITIVTDYPISATNGIATLHNWTVEVTAVNLATNQARNAGKKINGVLYLTKDSFSTYELPEINNVSTIDLLGNSTVTENSITVKLNVNNNTEEIDKYYYAIEEVQEPTAMVNNGIVRLSNIVKLAVTESDYIESNSDTHTFTGLTADINYKVYAYVEDIKGFKSNFYSTVIKTTDEIPPRIIGVEVTTTLDTITIDINAEDGDNEIDKYYYSIDGGSTWIEADGDHIVIEDLNPSNDYDVKIKVVDEEGNTSIEHYEQVTTEPYVRAAVSTVEATTTNNSITINVISIPGSYEIDHYLYSIDDGNTWEEGVSQKTFTGLDSNNTYTIKVKAVDENGRESVVYSLTSQPSNYVLPTISDVYVRPFPTTMTINITAVAGTNPIAKYYYSIQDGRYYVESTSSSYTFENLTSNATHYIKVYAEDSTGKVSMIYNTKAKTDYLNPSVKRVDKQENATNIVLTITGKKGSNEIDKYYYKLSSSNEWLVSSNNQITITGLTSNTPYSFDVKAEDTDGHQSEVFTLSAHTLYLDPTVVCSAEAIDYENILVTATVYVGSNPITGYNFKKGSEAYKGVQQTNTYTFGLLEPGTQYSFSVQVTDSEGHTATNTCRGTTNAAPTPTVTFETNGGSSITSESVTYKQTYGELTSPTKDGYQFGGWYKESTFNTQITSSTIVTDPNNHSLYAKWIPNRYTIVFNKNNNNATGTTNSLTNVSYEDNVTLTTNGYSLTGYTYQGWATSSSGAKAYNDGQTNVSVATLAAGDNVTNTNNGTINLYAVWSAKTYTVTLNSCSATNSPSSSATATYNATTLSAITVPTRSHSVSGFTITNNNASGATVSSTDTLTSTYTFGGWFTGSCASPSTQVASNAATPALLASVSGYTDSSNRWTKDGTTTLYAKWTGGSVTLPTITKTGYTCGWTTTSTGATTIAYASGASFTPTVNTTLYGVCVAKTYTITLNKCSATNSPSNSATATYNATALSAITVPTRSHSVSGFTITNNNASGATVSSTTALTSTYTFGGWYTGSCASPSTQVASNAATPALLASVSGYTDSSNRWTKDGTATLYAKWTGGSVTLPTITKTGYTCGWTATSSGATTITYASGASITPTANTTLYGVCVANKYTIVFNKNNTNATGTTASITNAAYASTVNLTTNGFSLTGYSFAGWAKTSSGSVAYSNAQTNVSVTTLATNAGVQNTNNGIINLYASWTINSYPITFVFDSGISSLTIKDGSTTVGTISTSSSSINLVYNKQYTILANFKNNYTLSGYTLTNGVGTISANKFTVGAGSGTIRVSSTANALYWNDNYSGTYYEFGVTIPSGSGLNGVYNSPSALQQAVATAYSNSTITYEFSIRPEYIKTTSSGHQACIYYNSKEFCMAPNYWDTDGATTKEKLKADIINKLNIANPTCYGSTSSAHCLIGGNSCWANSSGSVDCMGSSSVDNRCMVTKAGKAVCIVV